MNRFSKPILAIILILAVFSCKEKQKHNFVFTNQENNTEVKLTAYKHYPISVPGTKPDTIFHQIVKPEQSIQKDLLDGRFILTVEDSKNKKRFFFYHKDGIKVKFVYDGKIKTGNKTLKEYHSLMTTILRYENNYFIKHVKNIKNLEPIYHSCKDSLNMLESSVSEKYNNLFLEAKLYLDYALHPIISNKFKDRIGNFSTHKNGSVLQIKGSADSLKKTGFYKSESYSSFLKDVFENLKQINNNDFFLEGKLFLTLKQINNDLKEVPAIANYIDHSYLPITNFIENQIKTSSNRNYAFNLLVQLAIQNNDKHELSLKYNEWLIGDFYDSWYVKEGRAQKMINFHKLPIGSMAPGFKLKTIDNKEITLSSYKNKYILIDFWGTWCTPCRKEIPALNNLSDVSEKLNLKIIGIAKDKKEILKAFLEKTELKYEVVIATEDVIKKYGVSSYPEKFLIDKSGKLIRKNVKIEEIVRLINENKK